MASTGTNLTRTTVGSVTNQYKWTYSFWLKRSKLGDSSTNDFIFDWYQSNANRGGILFETNDTFKIYDRVSNSNALNRNTNRLFRDTNAWYHIVVAHDRTVGSPLTKVYINGVEETSFSASSDPSQNGTSYFNTTSQTETIGSYGGGSTDYSQMYMSHVHFCDGYYYQASDFGEFDSNGVWKIKTSPSVSYGNNGYFILKDGNSLTDQSPNTNNFTVAGGNLTNDKDNPSNVFCTLNPLNNQNTLTLGNNKAVTGGNTGTAGTIGVSSGKWYYEVKVDTAGGSYPFVGFVTQDRCPVSSVGGGTARWVGNGGLSNGDIVGLALDLDNNTFRGYINGSILAVNSNYVSGSDGTVTAGLNWIPAISGVNSTLSCNFGNGRFGTTAVSSAGTNASNYGVFEYDVPAGFTAICTKGLNL